MANLNCFLNMKIPKCTTSAIVPGCPHCRQLSASNLKGKATRINNGLPVKVCDEKKSEYNCYDPCKPKRKIIDKNTLGAAVGVAKSSQCLYLTTMENDEMNGQRYSAYLKAFAILYTTPAQQWNSGVIDLILKEGKKLYKDSKSGEVSLPMSPSNIYSNLEAQVQRAFNLSGINFEVELGEKFSLEKKTQRKKEEVGTNIAAEDNGGIVRPSKFKAALKAYFDKHNYCLLKINEWYVMIWRTNRLYFVLDLYGRKVDSLIPDRDIGRALLICLNTLENVSHLIVNMSNLDGDEIYVLREMKMVSLTNLRIITQSRAYSRRANEFIIVTDEYAYLKSTLHLSLKPWKPLLSRSALPVGVAILLASKIDHPGSWNAKVLDEIMCYGAVVCRFFWERCLQMQDSIEFERFPRQYRMGQFIIDFSLIPRYVEGTWECVPFTSNSELWQAIANCFENSKNLLMVQINHLFYAVLRKNNFTYLFDPYRHRHTKDLDERSPTLRMFASMESFLRNFNEVLIYNNKTTRFCIHKVQVRRILKTDEMLNQTVPPLDGEPIENEDVKSMNELICFQEDQNRCARELGEISEDDDEETLLEEPSSNHEIKVRIVEEDGGTAEATDDGAESITIAVKD